MEKSNYFKMLITVSLLILFVSCETDNRMPIIPLHGRGNSIVPSSSGVEEFFVTSSILNRKQEMDLKNGDHYVDDKSAKLHSVGFVSKLVKDLYVLPMLTGVQKGLGVWSTLQYDPLVWDTGKISTGLMIGVGWIIAGYGAHVSAEQTVTDSSGVALTPYISLQVRHSYRKYKPDKDYELVSSSGRS